jgi:DNA-binding response OmpR family regulator
MFVLIIDDDTEDRELFLEALREIDTNIKGISAKDGREALFLLENELVVLPDFIFLDINMPIVNGKECLIQLKKNKRLKVIPVIMYSTTSDTNEIKDFYGLGAHDFLIKPSNFRNLVEALASIIVRNKSL